MFLGHFAAGLGAKAAAPRVSLGTLFLAAQFVDLLWPTLLLLGLERVVISPGITTVTPLDFSHYPISHSLLMTLFWGVLIGGAFWMFRKNARGAVVVGLLVVSHWFIDLLVHRPDLPLYPGASPLVGLGAWDSLLLTVLLEGILFAAGTILYLRATQARDRIGRYGFWGLIAFLLVIYAGNLWGPPPESVSAIAWVGHMQWLLVLWAYWIDRHRQEARPAALRRAVLAVGA